MALMTFSLSILAASNSTSTEIATSVAQNANMHQDNLIGIEEIGDQMITDFFYPNYWPVTIFAYFQSSSTISFFLVWISFTE